MGLSNVVLWWEEWQLRILVLGSLFVQYLLLFSAPNRKLAIPSWYRSVIWLAYLGSDALAIYALATLFSRQRRQDCSSGQGNNILEVVWVPVLLMHLGGQDVITAYNIEDNELWTRHVLTAMSQITIAIYVFCKSWPGGDKRLLQASILLFVPGILKCIEKPWALKSASINSLVSFSGPAPRRNTDRKGRINSLEDYVEKARDFVQINPCWQAPEGDAVDLEPDSHLPQAQGEDDAVDLEANHQPRTQGEAAVLDPQADDHPLTSSTWRNFLNQINKKMRSFQNEERDLEAYNKLFLDLASPYSDRLGILKSIWVLDEKQASDLLQNRLFRAFNLLYTKRKMLRIWEERREGNPGIFEYLSLCVRTSTSYLPWAAIGLFHNSHKEAYNANDVKVALFCCTALLDSFPGFMMTESTSNEQAKRNAMQCLWVKKLGVLYEQAMATRFQWQWMTQCKQASKMDAMNNDGLMGNLPSILRRALRNVVLKNSFVGQYNLVGFFARNQRHSRKMCILSFFNCKDLFYQHWSMKPCHSSFAITQMVLKYVKKGWQDQIKDAGTYWKFNDRRGHWTLRSNKCDQGLSCSLRRPFDESVLLWHIATDFCFYYMGTSADHECTTARCVQVSSGEGHGCAVWCERSPHHVRAIQCREMSNYMIYLLFVKPEMLLSGARRNLLMNANAELKEILKDDNPFLKKILKGDKPSLVEILKCNKPFLKFFTGKKPLHKEIERGFVQRIIANMQVVEHTDPPPDAERDATTLEGFVRDAWKLAVLLLRVGDENKMWEVIEGVWVEMLCFSASRCRGYLHAKSLGTGAELLTYIWLLLSHMGMETLPERLQRSEHSIGERNDAAPPSTSQIHEMEHPTRFRRSRSL
uniref:Uncharacterized protein n=1 Tax=Avena sativa TaxID=4498 RepID=A0ACD5XVP2_AVESA